MTADVPLPRLTFVLGGARSGKSAYAQQLAESAVRADGSSPELIFVATAEAGDDEMTARIARHQADRGPRWRTIECPLELSRALQETAGPGHVIVVDCLSLWISNLMHAGRDTDRACTELSDVLANCAGAVILISNEVGLGIVPDNALARAFRDHAGRMHQNIAAQADRVVFVAAGLVLPLK